MTGFPLLAKRGGAALLPLLLFALSAQGGKAQVRYGITKIKTVRLDCGKEKLSGPTAFRIGPNGDLYFLNYSAGKLLHLDSTGKPLRSLQVGSVFSPAQAGFTVTPEGDLFLLDAKEGFIHRYDGRLDLLGKLRLGSSENVETVYDFLAASWGDLLLSCGAKPQLWRLEPAGKSFAFREVIGEAPRFYFSLAELPGRRLAAYDYLYRELVFMDRFGNQLRTVPFDAVLKLGAVGRLIGAALPEGGLALLDSLGYPVAAFKPKQLELRLEKIADFVTVGKRIYILDNVKNNLEIFELSETGAKDPEKR